MGNKSKMVKVLVGLAIGSSLLFGAVLFYASSKINPEELRKILVSNLEKTFPEAKVELAKIDYSLGLSITFEIEKMHLSLKEGPSDNNLVAVNDVKLKVPLWAIITNGGTIELIVKNPDLTYIQLSEGYDNWKKAMGKKAGAVEETATAEEKNDGKASDGKVEIPEFIAKSKINISFEQLKLNYQMLDGGKGNVLIGRFLIKDMNLKSSTAFEIASDINVKMGDGASLKATTLVIGQLNLEKYVSAKTLEGSTLVNISNVEYSKGQNKIPDTKTEIKFAMTQDGLLKSNIKSELGSLATAAMDVQVKEKNLTVNNLKIELILKELKNILTPEQASGLKGVDFKDSKFIISGELSKNGETLNPNLEMALTSPVGFTTENGININSEVKGKIIGESINFLAKSSLFGGNVNVDIKTKMKLPPGGDPNVPATQKMGPITIDVAASNIKVPADFIQKNMNAKSSEAAGKNTAGDDKQTGKEATKATITSSPKPLFPTTTVSLKWGQISIGSEDFSGNGKILASKSSVGSDGINFQFSKGKGNIVFHTDMEANSASQTKFDFSLVGLNLNSLKLFLPPMLENLSGEYTGKVKGTVNKTATKLAYNIDYDINAKNGEIKGINLTEHVTSVVAKFDALKGKMGNKQIKFDDRFEKFIAKGNATETLTKLNDFQFIGVQNSVELKGSGYVGMINNPGQIEMTVLDKTGAVSAPLKANVGTDTLPLKLVGNGFSLMPDYQYTIKLLAKGAIKTKGKEEAQKIVDKVAPKILDKVDEQLGGKLGDKKEEVKKLFKGFFK